MSCVLKIKRPRRISNGRNRVFASRARKWLDDQKFSTPGEYFEADNIFNQRNRLTHIIKSSPKGMHATILTKFLESSEIHDLLVLYTETYLALISDEQTTVQLLLACAIRRCEFDIARSILHSCPTAAYNYAYSFEPWTHRSQIDSASPHNCIWTDLSSFEISNDSFANILTTFYQHGLLNTDHHCVQKCLRTYLSIIKPHAHIDLFLQMCGKAKAEHAERLMRFVNVRPLCFIVCDYLTDPHSIVQ